MLCLLLFFCSPLGADWVDQLVRIRNTIEQRVKTLNNDGFCFEDAVEKVIGEGHISRDATLTWGNEVAQRLGMEKCDIRKQRIQREEGERFRKEIEQKLRKEIEMRELETTLRLEREKELKALKEDVVTLKEHLGQCQARLEALEQEFATFRKERTTYQQQLQTQLSEYKNSGILKNRQEGMERENQQQIEDMTVLKGEI